MIEFDRPGYLNTPIGDLPINQETDVGWFMVDVEKATPSPLRGLRATKDNIPQGDGDILHRRFSDGIELTIPIQLWKTVDDEAGEPACGEDLRLMLERLAGFMQSILNGRGRWFWTPSGAPERMLDECRWLVPFSREVRFIEPRSSLTTVTFGIDSPFPYFITAAQEEVPILDGASGILTNAGNHEAYPVIEVLGTTSAFTITNNSLVDQNGDPLQIVYDGTAITSPDFAEIDVFKNSIYLNGNEANLKSGVDAVETDYFFLRPGGNDIDVSGADVEFKWNHSWTPV